MVRNHHHCVLIIGIAVLLLTACGRESITDVTAKKDPLTSSIEIVSFNDAEPHKYDLEILDDADSVSVRISSAIPVESGHLLHITFPADRLTPESVDFAPELLGSDVIRLAVTSKPGIIAIGAVPIGDEPLSSGEVATITFDRHPSVIRVTGKAPVGNENRVTDLGVEVLDSTNVRLTWHGRLIGDYDTKGDVGVPDITPIAINYLAIPGDGEGDDTWEAIIDGDKSDEVGVSDISIIAQHYLEMLAGYHVYVGVPDDPGNPDTSVSWSETPLDMGAEGDDPCLVPYSGERHESYGFYWFEETVTVDPSVLLDSSAWMVVPTDGESEGIESVPAILVSGADTTPPSWQGGISIVSAEPGDGQVTVTWGMAEDVENPPVGYRVYYALRDEFSFETADTDGPFDETTHSAVVDDLTNDFAYTFAVRATDSAPEPNEDRNTNTIDATPSASSGIIADVPPTGSSQIGTDDVVNADIALAPGAGSPNPLYENGAPFVVYRDTENALVLAYYLDGWQMQDIVSDAGSIGPHKAAVICGNIVVAIPSRAQNSIDVIWGQPGGSFESATVSDALAESPSFVDIGYSETAGQMMIAYAFDSDSSDAEIEFVFADYAGGSIADLVWTTESVDSAPTVAGLDMVVDGVQPYIAFSAGLTDIENMQFDTSLFIAARNGADDWQVDDLSAQIGNSMPLLVSAGIVDGDLEIIYQSVTIFTIPILNYDVPIFHLKAYRGGSSPIDAVVYEGTISFNIFTQTADIDYALEPLLVPLPPSSGKDAFVGLSACTGEIALSNYPDLSGTIDLLLYGATQTGSSITDTAGFGLGIGRDISGVYNESGGYIAVSKIQTEQMNIDDMGDLSNLPAGPLYYRTIDP